MKIALTNRSAADPKAFPLLAAALRQFMTYYTADCDLAPCEVTYFGEGASLPPDYVEAMVFDQPDEANALAYHDRDERGRPRIKAFYGLVPNGELFHGPAGDGASLLGLLEHEAAEAASDLYANTYVDIDILDPSGSGKIFHSVALESCDPVQELADTMTVVVPGLGDPGGTKCDRIDYVLPAWFNPDALLEPGSARPAFDRMGVLTKPGTIAAGGYAIVREAVARDGQVFARTLRLDHRVPMKAWRAKKKELAKSGRTSRRLSAGEVRIG